MGSAAASGCLAGDHLGLRFSGGTLLNWKKGSLPGGSPTHSSIIYTARSGSNDHHDQEEEEREELQPPTPKLFDLPRIITSMPTLQRTPATCATSCLGLPVRSAWTSARIQTRRRARALSCGFRVSGLYLEKILGSEKNLAVSIPPSNYLMINRRCRLAVCC